MDLFIMKYKEFTPDGVIKFFDTEIDDYYHIKDIRTRVEYGICYYVVGYYKNSFIILQETYTKNEQILTTYVKYSTRITVIAYDNDQNIKRILKC